MGLKSEQGAAPLARHFDYSVQLLKIKIISEFIGTWALTSKICSGSALLTRLSISRNILLVLPESPLSSDFWRTVDVVDEL